MFTEVYLFTQVCLQKHKKMTFKLNVIYIMERSEFGN